MPLYDYKCTQCGTISEVRHGFNEAYAEACAACGGLMKRVFNPAPIVFKGSGFYVTDSRKSRSPETAKSGDTNAADGTPTNGTAKEGAAKAGTAAPAAGASEGSKADAPASAPADANSKESAA